MKRFPKLITAVICAVTIGFCVLAPKIIPYQASRDRYGEWIYPSPQPYVGNLNLWSVSGLSLSSGAQAGWVKSRVRSFEQSNFGIYIDVQSIDFDTARTRLSAGEFPDLMIFPTGLIDLPNGLLRSLRQPQKPLEPLLKSGMVGSNLYAMPLMAGGYALIVNEEGGMWGGISPPKGETYSVAELEEMANSKDGPGGVCIDYGGRAIPGLCLAKPFMEPGDDRGGLSLNGIKGGIAEFLQADKSLLMLGTMQSARAMDAQAQQGAGFMFSSWGMTKFTDQAVYGGVCAQVDDAKATVCENFLLSLTSERAQESLATIAMLPAVEMPPIYEGDSALSGIELVYRTGMCVAPCFGYDATRTKWNSLMALSIEGDAKALEELRGSINATCKAD